MYIVFLIDNVLQLMEITNFISNNEKVQTQEKATVNVWTKSAHFLDSPQHFVFHQI